MNTIIKASGLEKHYKNTKALSAVNFEIKRGQIVGLLGPNGAGKTSLLKAILGLTAYDGELSVLGQNPRYQRTRLLDRMCFIADVAILPKWLKTCQAIEFVAGVHPRFDQQKAVQLIEKTDIPLNSKVGALSKGMVVQLHLSLVMAIDAEILILDEPTLGLDILYRKEFYRRLLNDYYNANKTILITTHQVEEVEDILTDIIIINHGEIVLNSSMDSLQQRFTMVEAHPDAIKQLDALKPLYQFQNMGKTCFLFENVDSSRFDGMGGVSIPRISDIFVAKVLGGLS